jgi:cyanate permease
MHLDLDMMRLVFSSVAPIIAKINRGVELQLTLAKLITQSVPPCSCQQAVP